MTDPINLPYTICFVRAGDHLLMLNRLKAPNMGLWNGLGGRIEKGETPRECVIREVWEEAGLSITTPRFAGIVTWTDALEVYDGGMYAYVADVDESRMRPTEATREGILSWFPVGWVMVTRNQGVVSNIRHFLLSMLVARNTPMEYRCIYGGDGSLLRMDCLPLTINLDGVQ